VNHKVAIQGEAGSFHHTAAITWYGPDVIVVPCATFKDVFVAVKEGLADSAVVAIENSLYGSINEVYDLLLKYRYPIVGEIPERIHQCLIGFKGAQLSKISHVYSHPVAISQCSDFLDEHLPRAKKIENYDTSASVALIKRANNPNYAAIAGKTAAALHGMQILKNDIQNNDTNFTRFLVLDATNNTNISNKTSLVVETSHKPGALLEVLQVFNKYQINLSKLQSRPIPGQLWRYMFYIDIEADPKTSQTCVAEIKNLGGQATILGTYKKAVKTHDI
jgi:prephenate dehydratase